MEVEICGHKVQIDEEDAWRLEETAWKIETARTTHRVYRYAVKFTYRDGKPALRRLHREIAGAEGKQCVDHINGDTLDNRRENLRLCSHAENMRNRIVPKHSKTGFKGVYFSKERGLYCAHVRLNGKKYHAGYARTAEEAAAMYDAMAARLHGEFHRPNASVAVTV